LSAFRTGFSPFRFKPGAQRKLTPGEAHYIGTPCPHCAGALVLSSTKYSEYVRCPLWASLFVLPHAVLKLSSPAPLSYDAATTAALRIDVPSSAPTTGTLTLPWEPLKVTKLYDVAVKVGEIPKYKEKIKAAMQAVAVPPEPGFPYRVFRVLADAVTAAHQQAKLGSGFSLRRELMTARLWACLKREALSDLEALRVAFAVIASERATDDERPFYEELWRAKTATDLYPLPSFGVGRNKEEVWHPMAGLAALIVELGLPLWLVGEAGAGKTYLTRQIAKLLDQPYIRLQGSRDRTIDEVIGAWGYDAKVGSVFRYGVLADACRDGALVHVDEVSALPHEVTFEMHALLEGEPLAVLKNRGERLPRHPRFRIVANDNTVGEGEKAEYVGTNSTNLAFRDRWAFLRIPAMPEDIRHKLVVAAAVGGGTDA
jgi:hypothetical protein